jgi:hypothetical protein
LTNIPKKRKIYDAPIKIEVTVKSEF